MGLGVIIGISLVVIIIVGMRLVETRYRWLLKSQPAPTRPKKIVKGLLRVIGWTLLIVFVAIMMVFSGIEGIAFVVIVLAVLGLLKS
jgi:hypothetical protein